MRITNMVPDMQYAIQQSEQSLATALQQLTTGKRVNQLSDDPVASAEMVRSMAASANVDQYTSNVSALQSQLQTADSAIGSIVTSITSAITYGTSGANGTNSSASRQSIATQVESALSTVISLANTTYQGNYIFGGSVSSIPPFVAASSAYSSSQGSIASPLTSNTALTPGSVTSISDATTGQTMVFKAVAGDTISTLMSAVANAVSAGRLGAGTTATINSSGQLSIDTNAATSGIVVNSNDSALGTMTAGSGTAVANAYAYVGNSTTNQAQISDSMSVVTNVPGSQLLTSGSNVITSLSGLISALQSGTTADISAAVSKLSSGLQNVTQQRVPLDNTLSQLNSQQSFLGQETVTLTSQQNSLVGIDTADAATNLSQAELDNSAVLAAAAKVLPQTLLDYLK